MIGWTNELESHERKTWTDVRLGYSLEVNRGLATAVRLPT